MPFMFICLLRVYRGIICINKSVLDRVLKDITMILNLIKLDYNKKIQNLKYEDVILLMIENYVYILNWYYITFKNYQY